MIKYLLYICFNFVVKTSDPKEKYCLDSWLLTIDYLNKVSCRRTQHTSLCTPGDGTSCSSFRSTPCSSARSGTHGGPWKLWQPPCSIPGPLGTSQTSRTGVSECQFSYSFNRAGCIFDLSVLSPFDLTWTWPGHCQAPYYSPSNLTQNYKIEEIWIWIQSRNVCFFFNLPTSSLGEVLISEAVFQGF